MIAILSTAAVAFLAGILVGAGGLWYLLRWLVVDTSGEHWSGI